jgi:putative NADPH-quinone reductase
MISGAADAVVILASSRSHGNTRLLVDFLAAGRELSVIDLAAKDMSHFDYQHANSGDDFVPLIETLTDKSLWILATPVHWYTMSAQLKTFFDRLSDLLTTHKELGRRLRGRSIAILASGTDPALPEGFETPFRLTCDYLGLSYLGTSYGHFESDLAPAASVRETTETFGRGLFRHTPISGAQ